MKQSEGKYKRKTMRPIEINGIQVAAWSPGEPDEDKPFSQVHVLLDIEDLDITLVLRFKSRDGLNNFIQELRQQRDLTWDKPKERK